MGFTNNTHTHTHTFPLFIANSTFTMSNPLTIRAGDDGKLHVSIVPLEDKHSRRSRLVCTTTPAGNLEYTIALPDDAEGVRYKICLRNERGQTAAARVNIDGKDMGYYLVNAFSDAAVLRPSDTAGYGDRGFTFFAAKSDKAVKAGVTTGTAEADAANGAIVVTWDVERPATTTRRTRGYVLQGSRHEDLMGCGSEESATYDAFGASFIARASATSAFGAAFPVAAGATTNSLERAKAGATLLGKATGQTFSVGRALKDTLPPVVVPFRLVAADLEKEPEFVAIRSTRIAMPAPARF